MIDESADRSAAAKAAFAAPVPKELLAPLPRARTPGRPGSRCSAGARRPRRCSWRGTTRVYVEAVARAGKIAYPLPMLTNAALNRPGKKPGQYPTGGPLPHLFDAWKAGAPSLDLLAPDIYLPDFVAWCDRYARPGNPLFIPEAKNEADAAVHALYAIGRGALGFSPFAIENTAEAGGGRADEVLRAAGGAGAAHRRRRRGKTAGVLIDKEQPTKTFRFGDVDARRRPRLHVPVGGAGPPRSDLAARRRHHRRDRARRIHRRGQRHHRHVRARPTSRSVGLERVDEGRVEDGKFVVTPPPERRRDAPGPPRCGCRWARSASSA